MHKCPGDINIFVSHSELNMRRWRQWWMSMLSFRAIAQTLRWRWVVGRYMLNCDRWKHLADCAVVLIWLKFYILLLLVIGDSLFISTFAVVYLHSRVLEILHTFMLLKCIMGCNSSNYCSLLSCCSCSHILKLVGSERNVEWVHVSIAHEVTSICQSTLRNLVSSLEAMTCHLIIESHHIVVILVQHRIKWFLLVRTNRDLMEYLWLVVGF